MFFGKDVWKNAALIVVDVQRDFCTGGALAVKDGEKIIPVVNELIEEAKQNEAAIIASRDWHSLGADHFNQWPVHCIAGTHGSEFHPDLKLPEDYSKFTIVSKGTNDDEDGYSAFEGRLANGDFLDEFLTRNNIGTLIVCGLATDYCVKETAIDGIVNQYRVFLVQQACRGVGVKEGDIDAALTSMDTYGVEIV